MKKSKFYILSISTAIVFTLPACKKANERDTEIQSAKDHALAEGIFNHLHEIADQAALDGELSTHRVIPGNAGLLTSCVTITRNIDSTDGSGTVLVDYGNYFCTGVDSILRKGTIEISFTGPYRDSGTVITIATTNYQVGKDSSSSVKVFGERIVTNAGRNSSGRLVFEVSVDATIANYLNDLMDWKSNHTREWLAGDSTGTWEDDEYLITGSGYGNNFHGRNFNVQITEALHARPGCRWITSGNLKLIPEGKIDRFIDFGDGTCDDKAKVTLDERTFNIILR